MAELLRISVRDQLGAADPAASGPGVTVRLLDPAAQVLVSGATIETGTLRGDDPYLLWLAPDRSLLVGETAHPDVAGYAFASDVTDGLALFEIAGTRAGDMMAMGCTLAQAPEAGRCVQTVFGGVRVVLYRHGACLRLHVERQFAAFLLEWLKQAVSAVEEYR